MFNLDVAELDNYYVGAYGWLVHNTNRWCGNIISVGANDPAAEALAKRIGGQPSVKFAGDPVGQEFDVISDLFIGQSKPANFKLGSSFRYQAQATFEAAISTGRTPYFHFEGPPSPNVLSTLNRYAERYGITPVIDTIPLLP